MSRQKCLETDIFVIIVILYTAPIVHLDEKCWLLYRMMCMNLSQSVSFLYPRLIPLVSAQPLVYCHV